MGLKIFLFISLSVKFPELDLRLYKSGDVKSILLKGSFSFKIRSGISAPVIKNFAKISTSKVSINISTNNGGLSFTLLSLTWLLLKGKYFPQLSLILQSNFPLRSINGSFKTMSINFKYEDKVSFSVS